MAEFYMNFSVIIWFCVSCRNSGYFCDWIRGQWPWWFEAHGLSSRSKIHRLSVSKQHCAHL